VIVTAENFLAAVGSCPLMIVISKCASRRFIAPAKLTCL